MVWRVSPLGQGSRDSGGRPVTGPSFRQRKVLYPQPLSFSVLHLRLLQVVEMRGRSKLYDMTAVSELVGRLQSTPSTPRTA